MPSTSSNRFDASYAESLKGLFCLLLVLGVWFLHFGVSINVFLFFFFCRETSKDRSYYGASEYRCRFCGAQFSFL